MSNHIRRLRKKAGLTLEQLADKTETTAQQISRLEKGDRKLTQDWMEVIAPALGVVPAALISDAPPNINQLSQEVENARVLQWWGMLSPDQKKMIAAFARDMGLEILSNNPKKRSA
jgi:transcriptional regulator with XRE-family HTH domain